MSVRMHISHAKTASRRAHHRVTTSTVIKTATGVRRKHFVDPATGMYRGKQILPAAGTKARAVKKVAAPKKKAAPADAPKKKVAKKAPSKKND